eukprot:CAMPEP_0176196608 /NCGR_PEP_ID=MMETSP0121_2-20121125/7117_1 /TAXON_ID=160619 /ORGANISM="Kryptoperidinium foliaceum, Strain CCMP 1326" /LENGTH=194 /DNA_ID=CAMNT_0017535417 /DNA_START=37 /DNA_END=621 /DNA_ORIENTATION=-
MPRWAHARALRDLKRQRHWVPLLAEAAPLQGDAGIVQALSDGGGMLGLPTAEVARVAGDVPCPRRRERVAPAAGPTRGAVGVQRGRAREVPQSQRWLRGAAQGVLQALVRAAEAATAMLEARGGADGVRLLEPPLVLLHRAALPREVLQVRHALVHPGVLPERAARRLRRPLRVPVLDGAPGLLRQGLELAQRP